MRTFSLFKKRSAIFKTIILYIEEKKYNTTKKSEYWNYKITTKKNRIKLKSQRINIVNKIIKTFPNKQIVQLMKFIFIA